MLRWKEVIGEIIEFNIIDIFGNTHNSPYILTITLKEFINELDFYDRECQSQDDVYEYMSEAFREKCYEVFDNRCFELISNPVIYRWFEHAFYECSFDGVTNLDYAIAWTVADNISDIFRKNSLKIYDAYLSEESNGKNRKCNGVIF